MYVFGDGNASKSDKKVANSRYSLAMVQIGTAENLSGPFMFLGSGKNMNSYELSEAKLVSNHGAPYGSKFWLNKNGYMSGAYWIIVKNQFCKVIHDFLVSLCFYFMYYI